MSEPQIESINLGSKEISPDEEASYREKILAAKAANPLSSLKGNEELGGIKKPQMPVFKKRQEESVSAPDGVTPRPPGAPVLRPETAEQLQQAVAAGAKQHQDATDNQVKEDARLAEEARMAKLLESFDFADSRNQVDRILDNKTRRKSIESRCKDMDFDDLLMRDEVQQRVPIIPGKFEPLYRSVVPVETLYLKQRMARETVQTDQYISEKYNLLLLTCSLVDISGAPLPDHRKHTQHGFEIDDKLFDEKLAAIMRKSAYIIADLGVNYVWFDVRVRKLLNPDALGNG
jgi:hypothetical protein